MSAVRANAYGGLWYTVRGIVMSCAKGYAARLRAGLLLTAFLLLGLRPGINWLSITIILCAALFLSGIYDAGHVQWLQSEELSQTLYILLQFVLVTLIGAALFVYETLNSLLKKELHEEKIKLEHWASHDDLTGIANRFEFFRRLRAGIDEAVEREHNWATISDGRHDGNGSLGGWNRPRS